MPDYDDDMLPPLIGAEVNPLALVRGKQYYMEPKVWDDHLNPWRIARIIEFSFVLALEDRVIIRFKEKAVLSNENGERIHYPRYHDPNDEEDRYVGVVSTMLVKFFEM
jgi:hypothetical protein